jgi:diguanylate cyclase (GGDEF)-like protein
MSLKTASNTGSTRILFADDDVLVRNAFARTLRARGFLVDVARDGFEALAFTQEYPYAVVVTDQEMPGLRGTELISKLRVLQPNSTFVIVTGHREMAREAAASPEAPDVLLKPWTESALLSLVTRAVEQAQIRHARGTHSTRPDVPAVGQHLLIVEDNDFEALILTQTIERAGGGAYRIVRASKLAEACTLLKSREYAIILSDLELPDATGLSALSEFQAVSPTTPVVVVTGSDDEALALRAVQAGAQDYLLKGNLDGDRVMRAVRYGIERKQTERRLIQLAHYDGLTMLANRTLLNERLTRAVARTRRVGNSIGLLLVDLDHFKTVNDTYGHEVGDELLVLAAARLKASTRQQDTVARIGGDEFAVLLEDVEDTAGARRVAQRIVNAFATPLIVRDKEQAVTCSIGAALAPEHGTDVDELLRSADRALYQAKDRGRNCHAVAGEGGPDRLSRRVELERELFSGVDEARLSVVLLPVTHLTNGSVVSHEALLRWDAMDGSRVNAGEFLPVLDQVGQLPRIGAWVLDTVCLLLRRQLVAGSISVNISLAEFSQPDFVDRVQEALQTHGVSGSSLEIELGEATLLKSLASARTRLPQLAALGVRITIDDYGSGRSSLAEFAELPISTLKLTPSLLRSATRGTGEKTLEATLAAAQVLGWNVVAKSVETPRELELLRALGCRLGQGRLLGDARSIDGLSQLSLPRAG